MPRPIGWIIRDPELGKLKIEVRFFGSQMTFHRQAGRFEEWEEFTPTEDHWDTLTEHAINKLKRGKISDKHMKLVKARGVKF